MTPYRILIACETSGIARRAFAALGHDVWSCDLEPAEDGSNRHIRCDVRDGILTWGWDMLCVMHPPCTRLCRSGRRWMSGPGDWTPPKALPKGKTWAQMKDEFETGVSVFTACWSAPISPAPKHALDTMLPDAEAEFQRVLSTLNLDTLEAVCAMLRKSD